MKEKTVKVLFYRTTSFEDPSDLLMMRFFKYVRFPYKELLFYENRLLPEWVYYSFDFDGLQIESLPNGFSVEDVDAEWVGSHISELFAKRIFSEV